MQQDHEFQVSLKCKTKVYREDTMRHHSTLPMISMFVFKLLLVCVCEYRGENNLWELILFHVGLRCRTQVVRFNAKHYPQTTHLTGPRT